MVGIRLSTHVYILFIIMGYNEQNWVIVQFGQGQGTISLIGCQIYITTNLRYCQVCFCSCAVFTEEKISITFALKAHDGTNFQFCFRPTNCLNNVSTNTG